ncbi:hypothetical protein HOF40_03495 [Candidatus Parcubacteria bacterium]|jgi:hypothetical protein|nr:hypothetical protein [Candidatus Parcubacteria bacterium]MBT3949125.1 hypothetical protein [Candidatus Parcubacteria bacterium]
MTQNNYPKFVLWKTDVKNVQNAYELFGKKTAKRIEKSIEKILESDYEIRFEDVDESFIDAFLPIYTDSITQKKGKLYNVKEKIKKFQDEGVVYRSISLYKENILKGAMIYTIREKNLGISYNIFPNEISVKLPIKNITFVADYHIYQDAIDRKKEFVSHGKDRNLYGIPTHSSIGVANHKLRAASLPHVSNSMKNEILNLDELSIDEDTLIFSGDEKGASIKKALLVSKTSEEEMRKRYSILFENENFNLEFKKI